MVYTDGIYLIADSIRELQRFVANTGLPGQYLNSSAFFPHYRLPENHSKGVIEAGAKRVNPETLLEIAMMVYRPSK